MPWIKSVNTAVTENAWNSLVSVVPNCTPEQARRHALLDPEIAYFFHCREPMAVSNPAWPSPRQLNAGDCAFFTGTPSPGSAPQADGYTKSGLSIAYVNNISAENLLKVLCYVDTDGNAAVDIACIFAANLNAALEVGYKALAPDFAPPAGGAYACANARTFETLNSGAIASLQARGITVLLTFLGNHDAAGWSNFPTSELADNFVDQLVCVVGTYGLDGIDIDDEYSDPPSKPVVPLVTVTSKIKERMPNKILSKALYADHGAFAPVYNKMTLGETLTYGWEMSYFDCDPDSRLRPYTKFMKSTRLALGFEAPSALPVTATVALLKEQQYAGMMVYAFETDANATLLGELVRAWCGHGAWCGPDQGAVGALPG
ncbi:glycosyl hydrolase family 18 protein [Massilia sp. DJPM01]|uniref:glycosyl hydrolase family 18 protein n=1 Tax=Massilia sp. DJPM01 TaxID=3024404 RepID=UPI00259D6FA1|nr:glycosyl hydrolase family 18 protein [Massilia sp. DJPM01]MDM5181067.1 glycosyl hydrolase family 18 protein [Massilia sp. DJPM01]